jgi:hypothetical protein
MATYTEQALWNESSIVLDSQSQVDATARLTQGDLTSRVMLILARFFPEYVPGKRGKDRDASRESESGLGKRRDRTQRG